MFSLSILIRFATIYFLANLITKSTEGTYSKIIFSDGLIIQFGWQGNGTVIFPVPFKINNSVMVEFPGNINKGLDSFNVSNSGNKIGFWLAIGY